jgi:NADPH:quinone reductase-like Zn-dependent oxidoreductase
VPQRIVGVAPDTWADPPERTKDRTSESHGGRTLRPRTDDHDSADARAGHGEVRVMTGAAPINPLDWIAAAGAMRRCRRSRLPARGGLEVAGTITALRDGVGAFSMGGQAFGPQDAASAGRSRR